MTEKNKPVSPILNIDDEIIKANKKLKFFRTLSIVFGIIILGYVLYVITSFAIIGYKTKKEIVLNISPTPILVYPTPIIEDASGYGTLSWFSTPKKVPNPDVLQSNTSPEMGTAFSFSDTGTYEVAKFSSGASLLVTFVSPEGPSSPMIFRLISNKNKYYLIESLVSDDYVKKDLDLIFNKSKIQFISYQIKDLYPSDYYYINKYEFSKVNNGYFLPQFITSIKDYSTIASTPVGDILGIYNPVSDLKDLNMRNYYLKLKDFTLVTYTQVSPLNITDDQTPRFTLLDSSKNTSVFSPVRMGCGGGGALSVFKNDALLSDKIKIGTDNTTEIYQIKNTSSLLVKYLYNSYKQGRDYPSAPPILSLDQFAQSPNHIIYQEKSNDWVLLTNPEFSIQAECGKPVVYLYPTSDTQVSVQVGANVTKSEPQYPENGWNVLAHPNGQLDYQGNVYPNLFWEGIGYGLYPSLGNRGFIVPQSKLISTLNSHLKQQGLNAQESADFMEFWTSKLPKTPFVRLTWLTTQEMNILAPLKVIPAPQTAIRIFLDFEGLDKPISLIPQKLSAPARNGFTLVEWGGLLRK